MTEDQLRNDMRQRFTAISAREWCGVKGVAHTHVSEFLAGKRGPPSDLLRALNMRVDYVRNNSRTVRREPTIQERPY